MPLIRKCSLYTDADLAHALSFVKPLAERLPVNESCHPHIHRLQAELPACDLHTLQVRVCSPKVALRFTAQQLYSPRIACFFFTPSLETALRAR